MRKTLFTSAAFLLSSAILISSCSEENSGNQLSYQVKPTNFSASVGSSVTGSGLVVNINANSSLSWTAGTMNINEINFEAKQGTSEAEYKFRKLVNVDLFNIPSAVGSITIPDGTYDEVELKLEFAKSTTSAVPILLNGTYTDATGTKIPVELQLNEDLEIKVEAEDLVVEANDHIAYINMQLNQLLSNISAADLSSAVKTNGVIVISSASNASLYGKFKANFAAFADCDFDH